jgi:TldD protein
MNDTVHDPLSLARDLILRPSGLDDGRLDRVFGEVLSHSVDFADLYFRLAHRESWCLADGIVKDGTASLEQRVACARSPGEDRLCLPDEIVLPALEEAPRAARAIAVAGGSAASRPGVRSRAPAVPAGRSGGRARHAGEDRVARARRIAPRAVDRASCT